MWPESLITEIKHQRALHPNLGTDKLYITLAPFCSACNLALPSSSTIGRIIKDCGGLRMFPQKVGHNGKIVPIKGKKVLRKPKDFKAEYAGHLNHTYTRTPKMNARCERFNRTVQEEFADYYIGALIDPVAFNKALIPYLVWYNTERPHWGLDLKSPMQFMLTTHPEKSNMRWTDTRC